MAHIKVEVDEPSRGKRIAIECRGLKLTDGGRIGLLQDDLIGREMTVHPSQLEPSEVGIHTPALVNKEGFVALLRRHQAAPLRTCTCTGVDP